MTDEPVLLEISVTAEEADALALWHREPSQRAFASIDVLGLVESLAEAAAFDPDEVTR